MGAQRGDMGVSTKEVSVKGNNEVGWYLGDRGWGSTERER